MRHERSEACGHFTVAGRQRLRSHNLCVDGVARVMRETTLVRVYTIVRSTHDASLACSTFDLSVRDAFATCWLLDSSFPALTVAAAAAAAAAASFHLRALDTDLRELAR